MIRAEHWALVRLFAPTLVVAEPFFFHTRFSGDWEWDSTWFRATRGDPAWQAEWANLLALLAVDTRLRRLCGQSLC